MKKLTKVLLLVVALCMMIAVMGIAAAATGAETQKTIYVNATIKDGYTGVKLMKYQDYSNDISLTPVPGKENTYSAVVTAGERYNFYYTKSGGSESPGTFTVPTDNRDLLLVRPNPNGFTTDYLWHVYGQEYTDIGTVVGRKNQYVSSFPDLIYKGESVGSGNTNILRAILSDDSDVAVGSNVGDNYGSSVSFASKVGSTTMYCVVKDGNTFVNAKFTADVVLSYTVTFDGNGKGSWWNTPASQYIIPGSKATSPSMTVTGFTLAGWFKETGCTNEWDFDNDTVTEDITLYAKWVPNVAKIGDNEYTSLQAAINAAQSGDTIELLCDIEISSMVNLDKIGTYTINGAGHTISMASGTTFDGSGAIVFGPAGTNPIADVNQIPNKTYTLQNVTISGFDAEILRIEGCGLTLDNVTFDHNNIAKSLGRGYHLVRVANANVTIQNSTFADNTVTVTSKEGDVIYVDETSLFTLSNCLFDDNAVEGHSIVRIAGGSGHSVTNNTFIRNEVSSSSNGAVLYVSKPATVTYNLFKENSVTEFSDGKEAVIVLGSGATESVVNYNAFDGNTLAVAHTAATKSGTIHTGATCNLSYNYWGGNAESDIKGSSNLATNENYAVSYAPRDNANGCTVTLYVPPVAQIGETTYASLADAIAAANADTTSDSITITLLKDIDFSTGEYANYKWAGSTYNPLTITRSNVTIDLGGHTISEMGNAALVFGNILANDGRIENITIKNGTLRAGKTDNVTNSYVLGIAGVDGALVKNITTMGGINVYTGSKNVVIDSCNVTGTKYYTVCAQSGSDVTIKGTTYTKNTDNTVANKSMFWIQGAGTDSDMVTTENPTGAFGTSSITIESGNFTVDTSNGGVFYLSSGVKPIVKGGCFNIDPTACVAPGYEAVDNGDGTWTVDQIKVAQIGSTTYASLKDAIAAVPDNTATTIKMIADSVEAGTITIASTKNIVLDLNGYTVSYSENASEKSVYFITNKGTLTVRDTSEGAGGSITYASGNSNYSYESVTVYNLGGTLNLVSGSIVNNLGGLAYAVNNSSNAWGVNDDKETVFNMTGGVLSAPSGDASLRVYQNCSQAADPYSHNTVTISGGTLDKGIFVDTYIYNPNANTTGAGISTNITITGGTINGLIDLKLRHPYNTTLNIEGGDFTNAKLWVRKHSEWNAVTPEPTSPIVTISGGTWSFVTGKAFGLSYDCGATSWTSYEQPYCVTGGVFNVDLNNYSGIKFESGETGVANSGANKATYPYTVGVAVAKIGDNKYYASLYDAAAAVQNGDTITMIANTLETKEVKFDFNGSATLDLNGKTVATNEDIWIRTGRLTVVGKEESKVTSLGDNSNGYGFYVSTTTLENNDAILTIDSDNVTVDAKEYGVVLMTNGVFNLVKGHIVSHNNPAVSGNGTAPNVTVNISGGSIESSGVAIYFPATASLNITGGTITGTTAIYQKCGTLTISGGTINATGEAAEYSYDDNGCKATGDAIVIDNCGYPSGAPSASIKNATITSAHGQQIGYYIYENNEEGTVRADSQYTLNTNTEKEWVADTSVTGYSYRIATPTYVAKIGDVRYETLQAAINAAQTGNTVTLHRDVTGSFTIGKSITLTSVNDAKITGSGTSAISINASDVEVTLDGITIAKGATRGVCIDLNAENVTLVINNSSIAAGSYALDTRPGADNATVTVSDTTLDGWAAMNIWGDHGTFNISDSTLNGANTTTQSSSNDFAVIALEADTAARTSGDLMGAYADGNTITLTGCTIGATTSSTNSQAIIVYNAYGEDTNPSQTKAAEYLESGKHAKNNTVIFDGCDYVATTTGGLVYDGASKLAGGDGTTIYAANNNSFIVKTSGTYTIDPTTYLASGHEAVNNGDGTWTVRLKYDEATSTADTTQTISTTDEQTGTTTTTTTTTNLAADTSGATPTYAIKIETTVTTTPQQGEGTSNTETVYQPVQTSVNTANDVTDVKLDEDNSAVGNATPAQVTEAIDVVKSAVTAAQNATFTAALTANDDIKTEAKVLQTTAAANAIAKAAATVNSNDTANIAKAKIELQTTLKSVAVTETSGDVKATKVTYDIKPVAVLYKVVNNTETAIGQPVELNNDDIKEGESFTFTIPVPASFTAQYVKVKHISDKGTDTTIGIYEPVGVIGQVRYIEITVTHFSEFELEESDIETIQGGATISGSISLQEAVEINFYVRELATGTNVNDYSVVYYTVKDGVKSASTTVNGANWIETSEAGKYRFIVATFAAKEMTDTVTFKLLYNGNEIKSIDNYSIQKYCESQIEKINSSEKLKTLCKAVLDYGTAAQHYFDYKTTDLASGTTYYTEVGSKVIDSEYNKLKVNGGATGISKFTTSLTLQSKTELNFFLAGTDIEFVSVENATTSTADVTYIYTVNENGISIKIRGITATDLATVYRINFTIGDDERSIEYSPMTYAHKMSTSGKNSSTHDICKALCLYYEAAKAYFAN